jgi:UDP-glucose 4-epimerase
MMGTCLITGASGFIGRQVVSTLRETWTVFALVRKTDMEGVGRIQTIPCDLAQKWPLDILPDRVDAVIHLAQSQRYQEFPESAEDIFQVNVTSTHRLLDYAHRVRAKTFIFASSGGVYGHDAQPFTEERSVSVQGDVGFYLGTKLCSEILAGNYTPFMDVIILRFFFVYGPGQREDRLIPRLFKSVREGRPIILHGREGVRTNPTFVTDAASAVCRSLEMKASHKINVGGPEVLSMRQIGQSIGEILGKAPVFKVQDDSKPRHLVGDIKKMVQLLGPPVVKFREGISRCIEGRDHG